MHEFPKHYYFPDIYQGSDIAFDVPPEFEAWMPGVDKGQSEERVTELAIMQFIIQSAQADEVPLGPTATELNDIVSSQTTPSATGQFESSIRPTEESPPETAGPPELPPPPNKPPTGAAELPSPGDERNEPLGEGALAAKELESAKVEPVGEELSAAPPFDMPPQEAKHLGLTVTEWMRHRWTGEFPDRIEKLNRQTFRDQTTPSRVAPVTPASETPEPATPQENTPAALDVPTFSSHSEFKKWAVEELVSLTEEIVEVVNNPDVAVCSDIIVRAERVAQAENTVPQHYDPALRVAKDDYFATAGLIIDTPGIPLAMKTGLIEAMGVPHLGRYDREQLVEQLGRDLATDAGIGLCTQLLDRQTPPAEAAVEALRSVVGQKTSPPNIATIAASVLEPLTQRIQHVIETDSYFAVRPELRLLSTVLDKLDSEETAQQAEALGVDFQELADTVSAIFNTQLDEISRHEVFITHVDTANIMDAQHKLYCSRNRPRLEPSENLKSFLEVIYEVKLERYGPHPEVIAMRDKFNELAKVCGKSLRIKRWPIF